MLLWDRGMIHRDRRVQALLKRRHRVHCEYFPAYAPELNPAEYVWNQTDSALANCPYLVISFTNPSIIGLVSLQAKQHPLPHKE